ncbi:MAG: hypothetical protein WDZ50_07430 [Woeseia sp.]
MKPTTYKPNSVFNEHPPGQWRGALLRDVAVFQFKVLVDGLRDVLLVPVSLAAGVLSLLHTGSRPGPEFYDVLKMGRRSERWINLFGAADRMADDGTADAASARGDIDDLVARMETFIVDEYRSGGITARARSRLDAALATLRTQRQEPPPSDGPVNGA